MAEVKFVTLEELTEVLKGVNHAMPATVIAATDVDMNKTGNEYHKRITKVQKANVFIKFDYANSVNKQRIKEGKEPDFVPKARVWGVHVDNTPLIEHKGQYYLEARFLGYEPEIDYFLDGKTPIEKAKFEAYLPPKKASTTQDLENEVVMRTFKLDGVREVTINKIRYVRTDV